MRRILIDLTDLQSWSGHHGGTQRVAYGIAKQYFLLGDSEDQTIEFMSFSPHDRTFYKTDFTPIYDRTEQMKNNESMSSASAPPSVSMRTRLKYKIRPYVPEAIRKNQKVRQVAMKSIVTGVKVARTGKHMARRYMSKRNEPLRGEHIVFKAQDVVLILGKPWDYPNMEKVLTAEKARTNFKLLQVIYDLIIPLRPQLHHPSLFKPYTQYMFEAIYASDLLLPISKSTDKDIKIFADKLNLAVPETKVIRLADEIETGPADNKKPDPRINKRFIACVGTIEIRKNHTLLYYVYKLAEQRNIDLPQLVIVGSRGWLTTDFQYLVENDPLIKNKILILDNIDDLGLAWIYSNCLFSVYPSLYEGWGLPVAESLARGKLCISSDASSLPEVGSDLIDYFSPYDPERCLELIVKYLNPNELKSKEQKISETYESVNWQYTYQQISKAIASLSKASNR